MTIEDRVTYVSGWRALEVLQSAGIRPQWLGGRKAWAVDASRTADALAAIERSGAAVRIEGKTAVRNLTVAESPTVEPDQLSLFGGDVE